ncbi:vWA domain-containing protein [Candidatus Laterigemmans baculatus]|uniref:hypothetical protein n=1 Tax=Candidatus Laterigemmans baculatus TaxID=2770505 RepID=UPI0013DB59B9|nr:hypothetical protein [Candidatus Laterigemmans baculatus]
MPAHEPSHSDELKLELRQVRSRAEAARLEARAAEIELLLRQSARPPHPLSPDPLSPDPARDPTLEQLAVSDWQQLLAAAAKTAQTTTAPPPTTLPTTTPPTTTPPTTTTAQAPASHASRPRTPAARAPAAKTPAARTPTARARSAKAGSAKPGSAKAAVSSKSCGSGVTSSSTAAKTARGRAGRESDTEKQTSKGQRRRAPQRLVAEKSEKAVEVRRRKRSSAWVVSSIAHGAVLLVLAATSISVADPVELITLDAAPPSASEEPLETVVLEQSEAPEEASEPAPTAPAAELLPAAALLGGEIAIEPPELPAPSSFTSLRPPLAGKSSLAAQSAASTASEFFGAKGGGNHFVYLVDNSHSMTTVAPDGFEVARRELLKSIDALGEEQRFYVIFFGEEVLRMRLADPATPEPRSVYATAANKAALRRWVMGTSMQPGRWPEKALEFAFELRPDVIFLLTDGEMSQRAEPLIREHNLVENLFDGPHPRSTIHTIGFYSREGAEQMQTIARVNGGTYHFVPPPPR